MERQTEDVKLTEFRILPETLTDESTVYSVEVAVPDEALTRMYFECVDEEHANQLRELMEKCVEVHATVEV